MRDWNDTQIVYGVATCEQPQWGNCMRSWRETATTFYPYKIVRNSEIVDAYQRIYEGSDQPIIAHLHDDLIIHEDGWDRRVLAEFENPKVGIVGFAGAPGHGHPDMYKQPYTPSSMGRVGFKSNLRNAEVHGARFTGSCEVAVIDGLAIFVRRELLDRCGGWPRKDSSPIGYFLYTEWLCCMAHRLGYTIRLVGVDCDHLGGKSTGLNPSMRVDFDAEHKWLYENMRDVLPWRVPE